MAGPIVSFLVGVGFSSGAATFIGGFIARLAFAAILSYIGKKLTKEPEREELNRELQKPSNEPPKRHVYGTTQVYGSYAPVRIIGGKFWGILILNSRRSSGNFTVKIDKRVVNLTGDPYNFSGSGATATNEPFAGHCRIWIGRGSQQTCPARFRDNTNGAFLSTDAWRGQTVLFMELDAGANDRRQERWPRVPPEVEVEGDFSLVWDPRDPAQNRTQPWTHQFSNNQALCLLDSLLENPIEPYRADNLYLESFIQAAEIADEAISIKGGGAEPRYRVGGFIRFDNSELEDQIEPLVAAGGGFMTRVGGKLGYVAGEYSEPVYTLTDLVDDIFEFTALQRSRDLPTKILTTFVSADRLYAETALQPWDIPGAQAEDGGIPKVRDHTLTMVHSPYQAMRLRKIFGMKARLQRSLKGTAPPSMFKCIGGSGVTASLPAPVQAINGDYQVRMIDPTFDYMGAKGVAMRCPFEMIENSTMPYLWDAETEEEELLFEEFDPDRKVTLPGGAVDLVAEPYNFVAGVTSSERYTIKFDPSQSPSVTEYKWQYSENNSPWKAGGIIPTTSLEGGRVVGFFDNFDTTKSHKVRVQAISPNGASVYVESAEMSYSVNLGGVTASAGPGRVEFSGTAPDANTLTGVKVYRSGDSPNFSSAVPIGGTIAITPNAAFTVVAGDAGAVDLIENGNFSTNTLWTKGTDWTISGGKANKAPGAVTDLEQGQSLDVGGVYRFTFTLSNRTHGVISGRLKGGAEQVGQAFSGNFTRQDKLTAVTGNDTIAFAANATFDGSLDNIIVLKETPSCLEQGTAWFWIAPVTAGGAVGAAVGPFNLIIP